MIFFEVFEFAEELVIVGIGDFGLGLGVVEVVVVVEDAAELGGALLGGSGAGLRKEVGLLGGHGE